MKKKSNKKKIKGGNKVKSFFKKIYKKLFGKFNIFSWLAFMLIMMSIFLIIYLLIMARKIYVNQDIINGTKTLKVLLKPFPYVSTILIALIMAGGIFLLIKSFKI